MPKLKKPQLKKPRPDHWYIQFYAPDTQTGRPVRFRRTFDLNRIPSPADRQKRALQIIARLPELLAQGFPYTITLQGAPTLGAALGEALRRKIKTLAPDSVNTYRSRVAHLKAYLQKKGLYDIPTEAFNSKLAGSYLLHLATIERYSSAHYNNTLNCLKSLFSELARGLDFQADYKNPFSSFKRRASSDKTRRPFEPFEARIVKDYLRRTDKLLYLAVLLIQYCFIRPRELSRLRLASIDLRRGIISLSPSQTKNKRAGVVTIPEQMLEPLSELLPRGEDVAPSWHIFGRSFKPHPSKGVGKNTINRRHREALQSLKASGELSTIEGLSVYSWKDTGAIELIGAGVDIVSIRDQMRHSDLSITERYLKTVGKRNEKIAALKIDL